MQTLGMVLFYLATLSAIVFICFNAQFGIGWEALLKSPFGDRVDTIADAISSNLQSSDQKNWTEILKNFEKLYNVDFYVFDITGRQLAGKSLTLPKSLADKVNEFPNGMPPFGPHDRHGFQPPSNMHGFQPPHDSHGFQPLHDIHGLQPPPGMQSFKSPGDMRPPHDLGGFQQPHDTHGFHGPPPFMHAQGRFILHTDDPDTFFVGTKVVLFDVLQMRPMPSFVIASTNNIWQSTLLFDFKFLSFLVLLVLILSLIFWWPFVHQIALSIGELTTVTEKIAEGKFETRTSSKRHDEIGRLGDAVNTMAQRLSEYVSTQKRFLADISHELFSPLARLHMALELMESCKPEDNPRHMQEIKEEIDEMRNLINELLAFSKAGLKQSDIELVRVDLKQVLEEVISKFTEQTQIELSLASSSIVEGDPLLLSRSFSNILRNSVRYAGDAGPITVHSILNGSNLTITFSDCGPGVPEETLKYLGQPFFRPEFSRNRNLGGFGLGLAIVRSCIQACNGSVTLSNGAEGGLKVQVKLKALA
jgi:two-component system sensor histidine kinase CpxA